MAKYEITVKADLDELVRYIDRSLAEQSTTLSTEEQCEYTADGVRIKVMGYERFAYSGSSRVGMTVTYVASGELVRVIGIAVGGSQAMFMKINTWSESNFLDTLIYAVKRFILDHRPERRAGGRRVVTEKRLRCGFTARPYTLKEKKLNEILSKW